MANIYDKSSLVLIPSGTKTGKVFSQKPVSGDGDFTFTRASAATRVNADGNIEKETQNLLVQSNTFSNASWLKSGGPVLTSGQADPFGGNNAWKFESSNAISTQIYQSATFNTGSVYAKAGNVSSFSIWVNLNVTFDLSSGTITSGAANGKIEDVGGGWYRCSVFNPTANVFNPNFTATASGEFVYIAFSQGEFGLVARDVITTTTAAVYGGITDNTPRLDYTDSSCPALLLEPQRTNLINHSEYFGSASWGASNIAITSNATTSPEGIENATTIQNTSGSNYLVYTASVSASTTYQFSFYAKNIDATNVDVLFYDASNASIISTIAYEGDLTTEWKRLDFSVSTPVGCTSLGVNIAYGLGGSMHIYGAQFELGSYATSYIPTYGSSVTRVIDNCHLSNNSNLPTTYPFSLYTEFDVKDIESGCAVSLLDSSTFNIYYAIEYYGGFWRIAARNTTQTLGTSLVVPTLGSHKVLGIYTETSLSLYLDGALVINVSNGQTFNSNANDLFLGQERSVVDIGERNSNKQALVFNTALTDAEAIALTTI